MCPPSIPQDKIPNSTLIYPILFGHSSTSMYEGGGEIMEAYLYSYVGEWPKVPKKFMIPNQMAPFKEK